MYVSEGEEDEFTAPTNNRKGKSVARNSKFNSPSTIAAQRCAYQGSPSPGEGEQSHTVSNIGSSRTGSSKKPAQTRNPTISTTGRNTRRSEEDSSSAFRPRSPDPTTIPRPVHAGLEVSARADVQQIPFLSVQDAKRWKLEKRNSGGFFRKKKEPRGDFTLLDRLDGRDYVFLIDDSASMEKHWEEVAELCGILASMIKERDPNGFDVFFTVSPQRRPLNFKHTKPLEKALKDKRQKGITDIAGQLNSIISIFQSRLRPTGSTGIFGRSSRQEPVRPVSLYILTDGQWEPQSDAETPIKSLVHFMVENHLNNHHFMIQFITFGAGQNPLLEHLDNGLDLPLDIVDTTPSTGNVWKMLFGSTNRWFDTDGETPPAILSRDTMNSLADATTLNDPSWIGHSVI